MEHQSTVGTAAPPSSTTTQRPTAVKNATGAKEGDGSGGGRQQKQSTVATAATVMQVHVLVSGKVQGVFYRKFTHKQGTSLGLMGWVRNLDDGRVEIVAQGPESKLKQLEQWCHKGSPSARVEDVACVWKRELDGSLGPFQILRPLLDFQRERRAPGLEIKGNRIFTGTKTFDPDIVFDPDVSQETVVDTCLPIFESVTAGRNGTIMVYGQTGTGKTHTMFGGHHDVSSNDGIVFSAIAYLLEHVRLKVRNGGSASLSLSMIEIYNEKISDMLATTSGGGCGEVAGSFVGDAGAAAATAGSSSSNNNNIILVNGTPRGNKKVVLSTVENAILTVRKALSRRHVSPTAMNDRSSRSHVIVMLGHDERVSEDTTESAHLYLIDLAGSECLKKSLATGKAAAEAGMINKSLHALRNVVSALTSQQIRGDVTATPMRVHVPYRDSKLTELLQDSVGGTARTMFIACISLVARDLEETKMTLEYATKARKIKNSASDEREKLLLRIRTLEYQLQQTINKSPGSITVSKEDYEDLQQLQARLDEAAEQNEKLSTMLGNMEAVQNIEKYQQEENVRAIKAAEDERVRCVSYLMAQVDRLDNVKLMLKDSFVGMNRTVEEWMSLQNRCLDDGFIALEDKVHRDASSNLSEAQRAAAHRRSCPNAMAAMHAVCRRMQTTVDHVIADVISRANANESRVQETLQERSRAIEEGLQALRRDVMARTTALSQCTARMVQEVEGHVKEHSSEVVQLQQQPSIVDESMFLHAATEFRIDTLRDAKRYFTETSDVGGDESPKATPASFPSAAAGAVAVVGQALPNCNPASSVWMSGAASQFQSDIATRWRNASGLLNAWKNETLLGAPSVRGTIALDPSTPSSPLLPPSSPGSSSIAPGPKQSTGGGGVRSSGASSSGAANGTGGGAGAAALLLPLGPSRIGSNANLLALQTGGVKRCRSLPSKADGGDDAPGTPHKSMAMRRRTETTDDKRRSFQK